MLTFTRSLLSVQVFLLLVVIVIMGRSSDAKILEAVVKLFDAPNRVDAFANAPGHYAEKTIEFLAFGDAAMDYYQS